MCDDDIHEAEEGYSESGLGWTRAVPSTPSRLIYLDDELIEAKSITITVSTWRLSEMLDVPDLCHTIDIDGKRHDIRAPVIKDDGNIYCYSLPKEWVNAKKSLTR